MTPAQRADLAERARRAAAGERGKPTTAPPERPASGVQIEADRAVARRRRERAEAERRRRWFAGVMIAVVLGGAALALFRLGPAPVQAPPPAAAPTPVATAASTPSTGEGSEVGQYSVLTDDADHKERLKLAAKQMIRGKLKDPDSARFSGLQVGEYDGHAVVCGYVNSRNSFNGYSGDQRFAVGGMVLLEEDAAEGAMSEIWSHSGCR